MTYSFTPSIQCPGCGEVFAAAEEIPRAGAPGDTLTFAHVPLSGTCPRCGVTSTRIASESYSLRQGGEWSLVSSAVSQIRGATTHEWEAIALLLTSAGALGLQAEDLADRIERDAPKFQPVAELLRSPVAISLQALGVMVAILIALLKPADPPPEINVVVTPPSEERINDLIERKLSENSERQSGDSSLKPEQQQRPSH